MSFILRKAVRIGRHTLGALRDVLLMFVVYLPGQTGIMVRRLYYKTKLKHMGGNVRIEPGVCFKNPEYIEIGNSCWIDRNVIILAGKDYSKREKICVKLAGVDFESGVVHIGNNVHIGAGSIISGISEGVHVSDDCTFSHGCKVYAFSSHYRSGKDPSNTKIGFGSMIPHERQCIFQGPVFVGRNTGVAVNSVILPGVFISENCFVTVSSVVNQGNYESNSVISGNPSKVIGRRFKVDE